MTPARDHADGGYPGPTPPRFAESLLESVLLPGFVGETILGDLHAEFVLRSEMAGLKAARRWYTRQALGIALRGRRRVDPSARPETGFDIVHSLEVLWQDVRFGLRSLRRNRTTSFIAVTTFALGIAGAAAMFSVVNTVLLSPLPFPEPDRIVNVYPTNPQWVGVPGFESAALRGSFSYPELEDLWRDSEGILDGLAMTYTGDAIIRPADGVPERVTRALTTPDLLAGVLRVRPILGRVFVEEDLVSSPLAVVIGERYWEDRYSRDPGVIGRTIPVAGRPHTVIGVVPEGTRVSSRTPQVWMLMPPGTNRGDHRTSAIGRLASGVTPEQAAAFLSGVTLANAPPDHARHGVSVFPRQEEQSRGVRTALLVLAGAAFLLLLIACANVAALLVGRMLDRQSELAVRDALGASRGRLFRQIVTESTVLAGTGALLGVLLSGLALRGLELVAPPELPRIDEVSMDGVVLVLCAGLALFAGVAAGALPGLAVRRRGLRSGMIRTRSAASSGARLQNGVVVAQIAMATVLLVGSGLLSRTVAKLGGADVGFAVEELVSFDVSLPPRDADPDAETVDDRWADLARELESMPGVEGVALTSVLPLTPNRGNNGLVPDGYTGEQDIIAERRFVSAGFFEVAGIRLVEGRGFDETDDRLDAPGYMVISESLARFAWPGESAIGRRVTYWGSRETIVVGVAEDQRDEGMREATAWAFYVPRKQAGQTGGSFLVRGKSPTGLIPAIRERVRTVQPSAAVLDIQPMTDLIASDVAQETYRARLAILFAGLATLFSIMGIYGVTARAVSSRTREIGIRKALGGQDRAIMRRVYAGAGRLAIAGGLVGLLLAFLASTWIERLLWGVERTDPLTLVGVAATLGIGAIVAALGPGRRVRKLDPVDALRAE